MARNRALILIIIALWTATLACSLTRGSNQDTGPTKTPTLDLEAARNPGGTAEVTDETPPSVSIVSVTPGNQVAVGQQLELSVHAEHEIGVTRVQLVVIDGDESRVVGSKPIPATASSDSLLFWTPSSPGTFQLEVKAFRNTTESLPALVSIQVLGNADGSPFVPPDILATQQGPCTARVLISGLILRTGPGRNFPQRSTLSLGEVLAGVERANDASGQGWLKVRTSGGNEGWVDSNPDLVEQQGACQELPFKE